MSVVSKVPEIPKVRSTCPLACSLDIYGDKWSLLVIRDILYGKHKFGEFLQSKEGIPTNILTNRLKRLAKLGLVERRQYNARPARFAYYLTDKGEALRPVLLAIASWAHEYLEEEDPAVTNFPTPVAHERLMAALA